MVVRQRPQVQVVGVQVLGGLAPRPLDLRAAEARLDRPGDRLRRAVLQAEDVGDVALDTICPDVPRRLGLYQLAGDPDPRAGLADAALQRVAHAERAADLAQVRLTPLVREGAGAPDDEERAHARERRGQLLRDAVGEVVLLRVAAEVLEGQHHQGGPVRRWQGLRRAPGPSLAPDAEGVHRARHVLPRPRAAVLEAAAEAPARLVAHRRRDHYATGLRQRFQPRGDVHP